MLAHVPETSGDSQLRLAGASALGICAQLLRKLIAKIFISYELHPVRRFLHRNFRECPGFTVLELTNHWSVFDLYFTTASALYDSGSGVRQWFDELSESRYDAE
jgi:hypothetical protein